jgi:hypothetical protein
MALSFFDIPRELRNKIYKHAARSADGDSKTFSTFELPWALSDFVRNTTVLEMQVEGKTAWKIPKSVDEARLDFAPAIIDHPFAFTCKQALIEYIEEFRFHVGQNPPIAFAVGRDETIYAAGGVSAMDKLQEDRMEAEELANMILNNHLPHGSRIRLHTEFHDNELHPKETWASHVSEASARTLNSIVRHADELEFRTHAVTTAKKAVITEFQRVCNMYIGLVDYDAPAKITVAFPEIEEPFIFQPLQGLYLPGLTTMWSMVHMLETLKEFISVANREEYGHEARIRRVRLANLKRGLEARRRQSKH